MSTTIPIEQIEVGQRHRRDIGDIRALAESIEAVGLLHPIVVTPDNRLVAGERRLAAGKLLGWTDIPVTVVDLRAIVRGERAENTERKDFLPSEAVAIRDAVYALEREKATNNQRHGGRGKKGAKVSQPFRAADKAAAGSGYSGRTLDKASEIVIAASADPEKFGKLQADMDRTGRVDGPYKRLVVVRKAEAITKEPPPLPGNGPYRVIVADPPWPYELRKEDPSHRGTTPYPQMSIEQIKALDVGSIAGPDSLLWLWTTNHHMIEAHAVLAAWEFRHKTILTWVKDRMGAGHWLRGRTEHCLMATRGKPVVTLTNQTTVIFGPMRGHSRKPDEFYALVEELCPGSKAELFQRFPRPGWHGHGDEVHQAAE